MARKVDALGLAKIKQWEGLKLTAYRDEGGVLTIGYGHTSAAGAPVVREGMKITEAEASRILRADLAKFEARVNALVKVPLTDNQFSALVAFDLNTGALHKSTLLKKLNKGDYAAVPKELMKWVNVKGKRSRGLVNRRSAEVGLWNTGEFVASSFVEVAPEVGSLKSVVSPDKVLAAAGTLGFSFSSLFSATGPMGWALAAIAVLLTVGLGIFLFFRWRDEKATTLPVDTSEAEKAVEQQAAIDAAVSAALVAAGVTMPEDTDETDVDDSDAPVEGVTEAVTDVSGAPLPEPVV